MGATLRKPGRKRTPFPVAPGIGKRTPRVTYDYLDHSPLVGQIPFATSDTTVMTTTNGYDRLNRLTHPASLGGTGSTRSQFACRYNSASQGSHFCAYDGNGNVAALVKSDGAGLTAQYEYGPFGELLRATGPMAKTNPFRFSTKYQDAETDLIYYGYRYYNASTGRWPNGDPLEEQGGVNLYGFVYNNSISAIDTDGRFFAPPEVRALRRPWWWRRNVEVRLPESPLRIYVEKCEIVILIGEGYYTDENGEFWVLPHVWNMSRTCAYAAFLGCYANQSNDAIPWGKLFPSELLDSEEYKRGISRLSSAFTTALPKLQEVARSRAKEMLTTGKGVCNCCKVDNCDHRRNELWPSHNDRYYDFLKWNGDHQNNKQ